MDYKQLGFKAGLEIHQQLDTTKLFCSCPSLLREDRPNFMVTRDLRAVSGEGGEIDIAALHEQAKGLRFVYEGYNDTTCLVELDEEPPHAINNDALSIALIIAALMHCEIPEYTQVMRKTVVDGSNTSGFQRTILIGRNGWIEVNGKRIGINYLILEEDSARRTAEDARSVNYRLDRLGIPVVEIVTAPDMKTPEEVKETAAVIGMMLRSTRGVRRGIGTIRQDVNISITGHARVEMKGVQDLRDMIKYVEKEVERQIKTKGKEEPHVRNVKPDFTSKYLRPLPGAARMYPETDIPLIIPKATHVEMPELIEEKARRFIALGLGKDLAAFVAKSDKGELFEEFVQRYKDINPAFIAEVLTAKLVELKRDFGVEHVTDEMLQELFTLLDSGKITKEIVGDALVEMAQGKFDEEKYKTVDKKELAKELQQIIEQNKGAPFGALMGIAVSRLKGKASGKEIAEMLKNISP